MTRLQPGISWLKFAAVLLAGWLILALLAEVNASMQDPLPPQPPLRVWTVAADGAVFVLDAANTLHHLAPTGLTPLAQSAPLPLGAATADAPAYLLADAAHLFVGSPAVSQTLVLDRADFSQVTSLPHAGPMALDPDRHLFMVSSTTNQLLAYNPADLSQLPQGIPVDCIPVDLAANPAGRRLYVRAITSCGSSHHSEGYFIYDLDTLAKLGRVAGAERFYWLMRPAAVEGTELGAGVHVPYAGYSELLMFDGQGQLLNRQDLPHPGVVAHTGSSDRLYLLLKRGLAVMQTDDLSLQSFLPFTTTVPGDLVLSPTGDTVYLFGDQVTAYAAAELDGLGLAPVSPFPTVWMQTREGDKPTQVRVYPSPEIAQDGVAFIQLLPAGNPYQAELYRSDDEGRSWRSFPVFTGQVTALSISPDFATDRTLVTDFRRSTDGGETWTDWSPRLAFVSEREGNRDIYARSEFNEALQQLTRHPAVDENPAWSPAWTRLAFQSDRSGNWDIFTLRADCTPAQVECDLQQLTDHPADDLLPAWSPDGRRIAFVSTRDGNPEIYVMDKDGQNQRRLTFYPGGDWRPAWLPDSQRLVFSSDRSGSNDIYLLAVPPEADPLAVEPPLTPIVTGPADDRDPAIGGSSQLNSYFDFDIGPDGFLFFLSDRAGAMKTYVTLPDGSAIPAEPFIEADQVEAHPSWFNGYTLLAALGPDEESDIYALTPFGSPQVLSPAPGFDGQPAGGPLRWQPDEAASQAWLMSRPVVTPTRSTPSPEQANTPTVTPNSTATPTPEPTPSPIPDTAGLTLESLTPLGHLGGVMSAIFVQEGYAYLGMGRELAVLDISNPAQPLRVGYILLPQRVEDVELSGHLAYIAAGDSGLRIVDVSVPTSPIEIGFYQTPDHASGLTVVDNKLYLAGHAGLRILDISNPTAPLETGFCAITQVISNDVIVRGNKAYVTTASSATFTGGLSIVDISDPATPREAGRLKLGDLYAGLEAGLVDQWVYVTGHGGLSIIDATDPIQPVQTGALYNFSGDQEVTLTGLAALDDYLYMADRRSGLHIADISDPTMPVEVSFTSLPESSYDVEVAGGYAYVASGAGLFIFDVTNPAAPTQLGHYLAPASSITQLAGQGNYIYLSSWNNLNVIDVSNPVSPVQVSAYAAPREIRDIKIQDNYLYLTEESCANGCKGTLHLLDISDSISPTGVSIYDPSGRARTVAVAGSYAYVSADGLLVVDISNPAAPGQVAYSDTLPGNVAAVVGDYAYAIAGKRGLSVIDLSNPAAPVEVATQPVHDEAWAAAVAGNYLYLGERTFGFHVIDISNPTAPVEVNAVEELAGAELFSVNNIAVAGDRLYIAAGFDGLRVFDISTPTRPTEISFFNPTLGYAEEVIVRNDAIYASYGSDGLYIFAADLQ